ncbi:MAG TPA: hypothetical protein VGN51_04970 [Acidimicrobiia bacterium]
MSDLGMQRGTVELRSAGPIAFGPDGVLYVAENASATIHAIELGDAGATSAAEPFDLEHVDERVASYLGAALGDVAIHDLAVHPATHAVYLSVRRGNGDDARAVLLRIDGVDGSVHEVDLADVAYASVKLDDAPDEDDDRSDVTLPTDGSGEELTFGDRTIRILKRPIRMATVTDLAVAGDALLVAGLSNEEFASKLRRIPLPFGSAVEANNLEIFHVSHGQWETAAPIRTFVPYEGGRSILASYTCTPVVHFALDDVEPDTKVVGRTVAELGAMNQPLDMVSCTIGGEEHVLVANSSHGLIKIATRDIDDQPALTEPKEPVGVPREVEDLRGIVKLDNLDGSHVLALQVDDAGGQHLRSLKTSSL